MSVTLIQMDCFITLELMEGYKEESILRIYEVYRMYELYRM